MDKDSSRAFIFCRAFLVDDKDTNILPMKQRASDCGTYVLLAAIFTAWYGLAGCRVQGRAVADRLDPPVSARQTRHAASGEQ